MSEKEDLRKLIMLISELRAKDEERYSAHVQFMNDVIKMIRAIESQINKHLNTVTDTLNDLNEDIKQKLDTLLTGINPKGLKETSSSLKEIMETMNKSVQSMNLEKILSEIKLIQAGKLSVATSAAPAKEQPEPITTHLNKPRYQSPPPTSSQPAQAAQTEEAAAEEWVDPHEKKKEEDDEPHLLRPSDFFGD
ncbi:MAG: hypothetical protein BAJALOKI1v1_490013 [Promethearchaeota archaeon]|nr:MAG: hypothetical protein BAJALOKI1v1_490013 [Candidatus Lokiarchaeota archaeon]